MKQKKLTRDFFDRPTLIVAKELLGKFLVHKAGRKIITAMITETEAYCGLNDLASHASRGKTKRTEIMFGPPGHAYVYLIYGMYYCFNIVTERDGYPAAVLVRGVRVQVSGYRENAKLKSSASLKPETCNLKPELNGPGKLCRYLKIDRSLNNEDLTTSKKLWLEDRGIKIKPSQICRGKRIGVDYAGPYKNKPWRFLIKP